MNMTQALARLTKLLGKSAAIQDRKTPSSPEKRAAAEAARVAANANKEECEELLKARRAAVLNADAEYQRLKAAFGAACSARDNILLAGYRYAAVTSVYGSMFYSVKANADTLDELVEHVENARKATA